jgi:hypothetical protein
MPKSQPAPARICAWCGKPATHEVVIEAARQVQGAGRKAAHIPAKKADACRSCHDRLTPPAF